MKPIPALDALGLDELIGQTLCFGFQGVGPHGADTMNSHARELIDEMRVGAIVMLARNINSPEQARGLVDALQESARVPLLINVDQEGGAVNRIGAPFHQFPGNMALGAITRGPGGLPPDEYTRLQAQAVACELRSIGVNWNAAPVVDVNNNPDNPIIGVRSFGCDPESVGRLGAAAITGCQAGGVMACAKHFPGHGDTAVDSHLALPVVSGDRAHIESVELAPFRAAIAAGVESIMTTHIRFLALDRERPATLSAAVLTSLLREEMGFEGLIVTDCLEMKAVADGPGTARAAVQALKAGADAVLVCHTLETQRDVVAAIRSAVESGSLPFGRVRDAAARVLGAKRRFAADPPPKGDRPWLNLEHDALEDEIARASVTFARNGGGLPIAVAGRSRISGAQVPQSTLLVSAHVQAATLAAEMQRYGRVSLCTLSSAITDEDTARALDMARDSDRFPAVVVATARSDALNRDAEASLVNQLLDANPDLVAVALREPYDISRYPGVRNYVCAYGSRPCSLRAAAAALFGVYEPTGRIP